MPTSTCHPFLHQNKPSRESFICGKVNDWWTKRVLKMLNFTPKTRQNSLGCVHAQRQWKRKAGRPTTASTSGCWACSSHPTATAGVRTKPLRGQEVLGNCTRAGHFCQYGEVSHQKRHQDFTVKNIRRCAWRAGFSGWNMLKITYIIGKAYQLALPRFIFVRQIGIRIGLEWLHLFGISISTYCLFFGMRTDRASR